MMSNNERDDELIEGISSNGDNLSDEEVAKRIDAFSRRVKKQVAVMMSPKKYTPQQRIKATRWLGEAGEPTSIPHLVKVYQKDPTPGMKAAAKESLSQLKALGELYTSDDEEMRQMAVEVISDIVIKGQFGKPSRIPARVLRLLIFAFSVSAVVIFGLGLLIGNRPEDPSLVPLDVQLTRTAVALAQTPSATPTESDNPAEALQRLLGYYVDLDADSRALQGQMLVISRNQPLDCALTFANRDAYTLPPSLSGFAELPAVVDALNSAQAQIRAVYTRYRQSCDTAQPIDRQSALDLGTQLVEAQRALVGVPAVLSALGVNVPPTPFASPIPTNTALPTETPTPTNTPNAERIRLQVLAVQAILDEMNGLRGKNNLLVDYWKLYRDFRSRDGCLQLPAPPIPGEFVLPQNVADEAPPELQLAVDLLNSGLTQSRRSWAAFESACNANALAQTVDSQLPEAEAARTAFNNAQAQLDVVKAIIGR